MANLQTYPEKHPDWGDKVVLLSVSIDDSRAIAEEHLAKKSWDQSRNTWMDSKGGKDPVAFAYAGKGIPACYIVDANGKLVAGGHPDRLKVGKIVGGLVDGS